MRPGNNPAVINRGQMAASISIKYVTSWCALVFYMLLTLISPYTHVCNDDIFACASRNRVHSIHGMHSVLNHECASCMWTLSSAGAIRTPVIIAKPDIVIADSATVHHHHYSNDIYQTPPRAPPICWLLHDNP
ncbi:MAG: hypothetical protein ABFD49_04645 [Armatimonadota bacterium]|nr:hypothetical protein [bacterium]